MKAIEIAELHKDEWREYLKGKELVDLLQNSTLVEDRHVTSVLESSRINPYAPNLCSDAPSYPLPKASSARGLVVGYAQMPGGKVGVGVVEEFLVCLAYVDDVELHMKERLGVKVVKYDDGMVRRILERMRVGEGKLLLVGSDFERSIWKMLLQIPAGQTVSYQWVADRVGKPTAVRAVGSAIGRNPITYWVPCHRVVRSDGGMGGYAYGLKIKEQLLQLEAA